MHLYWIFFTGQPKVRLSARPRPEVIEAEEVSDEVVLTWAPCSKHDKSYEVEMWDLGKTRISYYCLHQIICQFSKSSQVSFWQHLCKIDVSIQCIHLANKITLRQFPSCSENSKKHLDSYNSKL